MKKLAIVSLGGNALVRKGEKGTIEEQFEHTRSAMSAVARIIDMGYNVVITHGNGPIVGYIVIQNEAAKETVPPMPLYVCDADSEGGIGFVIQQTLYNRLKETGKQRDVVAVVTQVVVDRNDPAFSNPTKPIGPFYMKEEAELLARERGWVVKEDSRRGYRRVVPSPRPLKVVEAGVIKALAETGVIVIAVGGGGVPVIERSDGTLEGIDAVIDKDLATSCLARDLGAELFINLTQIDRAYINFGKSDQKGLDNITVEDARTYLKQGEFAPGSMGPKIEAAIEFIEIGGREVIITTPELIDEAMEGKAGTRITL
ncbi:MAG: carbamate kinase [Deltaproteobacteria bacterium]|nr:carbamate kinase [Deltaproteobacteria bacterium]